MTLWYLCLELPAEFKVLSLKGSLKITLYWTHLKTVDLQRQLMTDLLYNTQVNTTIVHWKSVVSFHDCWPQHFITKCSKFVHCTVLVIIKLTKNLVPLRFCCSAVNWNFVVISPYFAIFKNVVHSLEPGETPSNSASHQAPNFVQRS